jgi:hypothetical protein
MLTANLSLSDLCVDIRLQIRQVTLERQGTQARLCYDLALHRHGRELSTVWYCDASQVTFPDAADDHEAAKLRRTEKLLAALAARKGRGTLPDELPRPSIPGLLRDLLRVARNYREAATVHQFARRLNLRCYSKKTLARVTKRYNEAAAVHGQFLRFLQEDYRTFNHVLAHSEGSSVVSA